MNIVRITLAIVALCAVSYASDWPQFRGPSFNGSSDEKGLLATWNVESGEGIAWVADLPGPSAATPAVVGGRIFVSSTDPEAKELEALCVDAKTGKILWSKVIGNGIRQDERSSYAEPSPAADSDRVVFFYGSGELLCHDHDGNEQWARNLQKEYGEFAFQWTFATSPLLYDGKLYMQVLQRDTPARGRGLRERVNESYILALDPKTGKELWRRLRPSEARAESREAFTTPIPWVHEGKKQILVIGGDVLTSHDPASGDEFWRWGTWNPTRITHWRHVPSPIAGDGVILVCAPKQDPVYAIRAGGEGVRGDDAVLWISEKKSFVSSDVPTPAFYDGDFFVLSDVRKTLTRVEPKTGKQKWQIETPGFDKYEASPLAADGKIYALNFGGEVLVVDAAKGEILALNKMNATRENPVRASVVAAGGKLYIRTNRKLWAIGAK